MTASRTGLKPRDSSTKVSLSSTQLSPTICLHISPIPSLLTPWEYWLWLPSVLQVRYSEILTHESDGSSSPFPKILWRKLQQTIPALIRGKASLTCSCTETSPSIPSPFPLAKTSHRSVKWTTRSAEQLPPFPLPIKTTENSLQPLQQLVKAAGLLQKAAGFSFTSSNMSPVTQKWARRCLYHTRSLPPVSSPLSHRKLVWQGNTVEADRICTTLYYTAEDWESVLATAFFLLLGLRKSIVQCYYKVTGPQREAHKLSQYCHLQLCPLKMAIQAAKHNAVITRCPPVAGIFAAPVIFQWQRADAKLLRVILQSE